MEKKLSDYIHYYIGCRIQKDSDALDYPTIEGVHNGHVIISEFRYKTPHCDKIFIRPRIWHTIEFVKPILRKLDSLTDDEIKEFIEWASLNEKYCDVSFERGSFGIIVNYSIDAGDQGVHRQSHNITFHAFSPKELVWLLSKGFDLFFLIKNGLAIDAATLTK
jgi:hypothetical protein